MGRANQHGKRPVRDVAHPVMSTGDVKRKYLELIKRFKQIQTQFENAKTDQERNAALAEMRKLSDQTHALLNNRPTRFTGA